MGSSDTAVAVVVFMCVLIVGWCAVIGKFCKEGWGREGSLLNPSRAVDVREVRRGLLSGGRNPALDAAHGGAGGKQEVGALGLAKGLSPAETARKQAQRAARAEATTGSPAPMKSSSGNSVVDVVNPVRQAPAGPEVDIEQPKPRVQNPMMVVEQAVAEQPPKKDKKPHKLSKKEQKKAAAAAAKAQTDAEATKAQADAEVALQVLVQEREAAAEAVESLRTAVGAAKKKKVKAGLQEELNQAETRLQRALVAAPLRPASEHVQEEPAVGSREWEDKIRAKLDARDAENRRLGAEKKGRKALIHDKERVLIALEFTHGQKRNLGLDFDTSKCGKVVVTDHNKPFSPVQHGMVLAAIDGKPVPHGADKRSLVQILQEMHQGVNCPLKLEFYHDPAIAALVGPAKESS